MKKVVGLVLLMVFSFSVLTGCTPTVQQYFKDSKQVLSWKGAKETSTMELMLKNQSETFKVPMKIESESLLNQGQATLAHIKIDFGQVQFGATKATLPQLDAFMDVRDVKRPYVMINTEFAKAIAQYVGETGDVDFVKTKYIGFHLPMDANSSVTLSNMDMLQSPTKILNSFENLLNDLYKGIALPVDMKKDGNTYSLTVNEDDMAKLADATLKGLTKNKDVVKKDLLEFLPVGASESKEISTAIDEIVKSEANKELQANLENVKAIFKGSSFSIKQTMDQNSVSADMKMNLNMKDINNVMNVVMNVNQKQVRDDNIKIDMPSDVTVFNFEALAMRQGNNTPVVFVNNKQVSFDVQPKIENGRVLVPMRAAMTDMGANVTWDAKKQEVKVVKDKKEIILPVGKKEALVDNKKVTLDVPAKIENGRTLIPLRFLGESTDYKVQWYQKAYVATLSA